MLRVISIIFICVLLHAGLFGEDESSSSDKTQLQKAKQQFAAQQDAKKKSARTQKKWAKTQKKAYNKAVKSGHKSTKKGSVKATSTRAVKR